jgi:hypothetical protein
MWIKTKTGLFNADNFERFETTGNATFGYAPGSSTPKVISTYNVMSAISNALQNKQDFLEVE